MSDTLRDRIAALARCSFLPGSTDKRFVQAIWGMDHTALTIAQCDNVDRLSRKYRRQMPEHLIAEKMP